MVKDLVERLRTSCDVREAALLRNLAADALEAKDREIAALRELLRECIPSLQRDGRPHIVTLVQAALGDIVLATDEPYCTCPDDYMAGVHHPDCISQKGDAEVPPP